MANTTIYNLPALNTVDSTSLFPLSSNVTATPTTYQASIGNIGHAITGNLRMSGDNLSSTNQIVGIYGNGTDQATALTLTNSGDAALWANANVTINSNSQGINPQWIFDTTGNLVLPGGIVDGLPQAAIIINQVGGPGLWTQGGTATPSLNYSDFSNIVVGTDIYVTTGSGSNQWTFDTNGNLTLPNGGRVSGNTGISFESSVDGNTSGLYTTGDIIEGGNTYLYATNNVYVRANNNGTNQDWIFGTDGNLSIPNGGGIRSAGGKGEGTMITGGNGNITSLTSYYSNGFYSGCVTANADGNVLITTYPGSGSNVWQFGVDGNLTLPGNTWQVNYANGTLVPIGGGGNANTGNVTFSDQVVIGTGDIYGGGGLYLAPGTASTANLQYLRVRGGDQPTHIHLDTGNYEYYDQYFGDDSKYLKLEAGYNGNILIGTVGVSYVHTWNFGSDGNLTAPGNIIMDNGNDGNIESTGNVNIISNGNTWVFGTDSNTTFPIDGNVNLGNIAIATHANFVVSAFIGNSSANIFLNYDGTGNFTGNLTSANANLGNLATANYVNVSANITSGNADLGNLAVANYFSTSGAGGDIVLTGGNISGANVITANTFVGNGSQLTDIVTSVPSQTILPTIQSITAIPMLVGYLGGGQGGVTVTVANTIPVTEYGVIVTAGTNVQTYAPGDLGSIPGTGNITFTTGLSSPASFTVYAYVTSNAGTYYSDAVTGTSGLCLLAGTQIALSDGSHKAIEHITYTDKLLSWDFDRGCYAETTAMWIKHSETGSQYNLLTFSDGTTLRTFDQHRIFNKQAGAFTYPMTDATPIGTITVNEHGQEITLTNKQVIKDTIEYYNVITDYHMNLFSDSVLTSCRFNNIYPITDMKFVKDGRTLRTRDEFENVPDRFFNGLRLAEQTTDIETVEWYVNRLLSSEVLTQSELTV